MSIAKSRRRMAYHDPMDLSFTSSSPPPTLKPRSTTWEAPSAYKLNAAVPSLDSPVEHYTDYNSAENIQDRFNHYCNHSPRKHNFGSSPMPDLTEDHAPDDSPLQRFRDNVPPPPKPSRPLTYEPHFPDETQSSPKTLDYMTISPPPPKAPITVLLVLTPHPASEAEHTALEAFGPRFCEDFSNAEQEWRFVSLYAHFRECMLMADHCEVGGRGVGECDEAVGIGSIHPYALRDKVEREKEVQWRLGVPVLQALIDREFGRGGRAFVVCGLPVGDVQGVKAFGAKIAEPAGILAFLPDFQLTAPSIPAKYSDKAMVFGATPLAQAYDALLAALHAQQTAHKTDASEMPDVASDDSDEYVHRLEEEGIIDRL